MLAHFTKWICQRMAVLQRRWRRRRRWQRSLQLPEKLMPDNIWFRVWSVCMVRAWCTALQSSHAFFSQFAFWATSYYVGYVMRRGSCRASTRVCLFVCVCLFGLLAGWLVGWSDGVCVRQCIAHSAVSGRPKFRANKFILLSKALSITVLVPFYN